MKLQKYIFKLLNEAFAIDGDNLKLVKPFDDVQVISIDGIKVYALFGDIDYYANKEAILTIKGKSNQLILNQQSYQDFLKEFKNRFNAIPELSNADVVASIETSANINGDIVNIIQKPYYKDGFKKNDQTFKMKDIKVTDRQNISNVFNLNFDASKHATVCVLDDFITSGTSFKNAFATLPSNIDKVGVCLFVLKS
jgi:DNA-directed RNA polymerase subunit H (RpoH/RPB5)